MSAAQAILITWSRPHQGNRSRVEEGINWSPLWLLGNSSQILVPLIGKLDTNPPPPFWNSGWLYIQRGTAWDDDNWTFFSFHIMLYHIPILIFAIVNQVTPYRPYIFHSGRIKHWWYFSKGNGCYIMGKNSFFTNKKPHFTTYHNGPFTVPSKSTV